MTTKAVGTGAPTVDTWTNYLKGIHWMIGQAWKDEDYHRLNDFSHKVANLEIVIMQEHHCHAHECATPVKPELLMCAKHWRMVPKRIQRLVWKYYRPGQCDDKSPSIEWLEAARQAMVHVMDIEMEQGKIQFYNMMLVEPVIDGELA